MSHDLLQTRVFDMGAWTINGANNLFFDPGTKIRAKRLILSYTTGNTTAPNVVTVKRRPLAGVAANEVSLFSFPTTTTTDAGDIDYVDLANPSVAGSSVAGSAAGSPASTVYTADDENYPIIWPGQDIGFYSDGAGTAGVVSAFLEYEELPFVAAEVDIGIGTTLDVRKLTITSL